MKYLIVPIEDVLNLTMTFEPEIGSQCEIDARVDRMGTIDLVDPVYEGGVRQWRNYLTTPRTLPSKKN